ncbi:MAG: hypothetical protein EHM18_18145 [Acidobacteria bacterium]|nr:MAG: hypothetical protein EHM18_18145 [Acidobacteriota bacterium]
MLGLPALPLPQLTLEMARSRRLEAVVVTLGGKGVLAASPQEEQPVYVPGFRVPVVDSLGSGDAFSAGFIHRLLRGATLGEACVFGNLMGAVSATKRGATASISRDEITELGRQSGVERIVEPELAKFREGEDFQGA